MCASSSGVNQLGRQLPPVGRDQGTQVDTLLLDCSGEENSAEAELVSLASRALTFPPPGRLKVPPLAKSKILGRSGNSSSISSEERAAHKVGCVAVESFFEDTPSTCCAQYDARVSTDFAPTRALQQTLRFMNADIPICFIKVLPKRADENGGVHDVKNCILALGLGNTFTMADFQEKELFTALHAFMRRFSPSPQEHELSEYMHTITALQVMVPSEPTLARFTEVVQKKPYSVTVMNYDEMCKGRIVLGAWDFGGALGLEALANFAEVKQKIIEETPFRHAFVIKNQNTWSSLVLEKSEKGLCWFGFNSSVKAVVQYAKQVGCISEIFQNSDAFISSAFKYNVGEDIRQKAGRIRCRGSAQGRATSPDGAAEITDGMVVDTVLAAAKFMQRVGWLKNPGSHGEEIENLKALTNFYLTHLEGDPRVCIAHKILNP